METLKYDNIIVILSTIVIILIMYRLLISKEYYSDIDICDYNSPNPNEFCKSIQQGCSDLILDNKNLNLNIKQNCSELPTDTKDMIDTAIVCNDTANKLIMNNYVRKEVCSQIKNFPDKLPNTNVLTPSTNILQQTSLSYVKNEPSPTYKSLDPIEFLSTNDNNFNNIFSNTNYASF
jgi:hypothetical protein